jgi:hypothetical protein
VNGVWELLQSPLYSDHPRGFFYVLWTRLHCTGGDALILLGAFWGTSLIAHSRVAPPVKKEEGLMPH